MPVEIKKLIIKGIVQETIGTRTANSTISHKPNKIEIEREEIKLHRFRRQILSECKEMIQTEFERKSNRY